MKPYEGNKTSPENIEENELEKVGDESGAGNGHHPKNIEGKDTSENGKCNHTEYIPSQIVSFVATSGVNTVSNGPSGQPTANSSRKNEGITDSKKYRESQSLYVDSEKEIECEDNHVTKKRKVELDDSDVSKVDSSTNNSQNQKLENTKLENSSNCAAAETAKINDQIEDKKCSERNEPGAYIPSEYGSFQKSGSISTTTKSKLSATDKIPAQSTNTPNSKGGISHKDA